MVAMVAAAVPPPFGLLRFSVNSSGFPRNGDTFFGENDDTSNIRLKILLFSLRHGDWDRLEEVVRDKRMTIERGRTPTVFSPMFKWEKGNSKPLDVDRGLKTSNRIQGTGLWVAQIPFISMISWVKHLRISEVEVEKVIKSCTVTVR